MKDLQFIIMKNQHFPLSFISDSTTNSKTRLGTALFFLVSKAHPAQTWKGLLQISANHISSVFCHPHFFGFFFTPGRFSPCLQHTASSLVSSCMQSGYSLQSLLYVLIPSVLHHIMYRSILLLQSTIDWVVCSFPVSFMVIHLHQSFFFFFVFLFFL